MTQRLPNPPRLINPNAEGAYDWREFDRFIRQLTALLGAPISDGVLNLANVAIAASSAQSAAGAAQTVASDVAASNTEDVTLGTANGLSLVGQALSLQTATDSQPGALTAADHLEFKGKQSAASVSSAPASSTLTVPATITIYGAASAVLGAPTVWASFSVGGTAYKIPLY